jgi:hypothetical protein
MNSDIRIIEVQTYTVPTRCRTPLKFGSVVVDELPIGYAKVVVENRAGATAEGWGAMFLMDLWAWPTSQASHEAKNRVMCDLLNAYAQSVAGYAGHAHPIEIFVDLEEELRQVSQTLSARHTPGEKIPFLGALISASPVDHAIHDAFGKVNGISSYCGYGPAHMAFDLSRYLGPEYQGVYPAQYLRQEFVAEIPIFHLVGGLDLLCRSEVTDEFPQDGIPNSLDDWIERDGVYCLKVKLNGRNLEWDLDRTKAVSLIYQKARTRLPSLRARPYLTVDTNEQCESPEYILE